MVALFAFLPLLRSRAVGLALRIVRPLLVALRPRLTLLALLQVRPLLTVSSIVPMRPVASTFAPAIAIFVATGTRLAACVALTEAVALAAVAFLPVGSHVATRGRGRGRLRLYGRRCVALEPPEHATEEAGMRS
ncbi:MAG TPA: hypothetical protein VFI80_06440, partial [Burkholderiales bacterium]|nr:hypothetical protein [Burkholderiales bacterium]